MTIPALLLAPIAAATDAPIAPTPPDGTAARPHTAETLHAGEAVLRWPLGRSAVGLTDRTTAWIAPLDLSIGGPRLGLEHGGGRGQTGWSLAPSIGAKANLRRASLRLESTLSHRLGPHQLSAQWGLDLRALRRLSIDEAVEGSLGLDRLQSHLLFAWDTPHARLEARLPLRDRDRTLTWGSGSAAWVHTTQRTYLSAGLGLLVGRPSDQYTLGAYEWWFWLPYPEIDLAIRLGR